MIPRPPRQPPIRGRLRAGIIINAAFVGGAERWICDLVDATQDRIDWRGVGLVRGLYGKVFPSQLNTRLLLGDHGCRELAGEVDVLLVWTIKHPLKYAPRGVPIVAISHSPPQSDWARNFFGDDGVIGADHYAAVSENARDCFPEQFQESTKVIGHAINPKRLEPKISREEQREQWGVHEHAIVLGYLGRFSIEKRQNLVWSSLMHLPGNYCAVLLGDGQKAIVDKAESEWLGNRVRILPPTPDVGSALHAMDVLVVPSEYESFCYAMLEGWTSRTPVVCTRTGVAAEHPEWCYLLPDEPTPRAVARQVLKTANYERVCHAASQAPLEYSWKKFGDEWVEYLWMIHVEQCVRLYGYDRSHWIY